MEKHYNFPAAQAKFEEVTKDKSLEFSLAVFMSERLMAQLSMLRSSPTIDPRVMATAVKSVETVVIVYCTETKQNPDEVLEAATQVLEACYKAADEQLNAERGMSYMPGSTTLQ